MQVVKSAVRIPRRKRRGQLTIARDGQLAISLYDEPPVGIDFEAIELSLIEKICRERQRVLQHIEAMDLLDGDFNAKKRVTWVRITETTNLLEFKKTSTFNEQRRNDELSHWLLKLAFCRSDELKRWFIRTETDLFRIRFSQLEKNERSQMYLKYKMDFPEIPEAEIEEKRPLLTGLHVSPESNFSAGGWYRVPFQKVAKLVKLRHVYLERGFAYVPEASLSEFFVTQFRAALSKSMALASQKASICLQGEDERLAPILKSFSNLTETTEFSTEEGRLTLANFDAVAKASFPPCVRQKLDAVAVDHKLKHDGRVHMYGFLKAAGLTLDETMKWMVSNFTAYVNAEKEHGYNVRHAYGREGHGKGLGSFGCATKINAIPADGQYHGCPFKHSKKLANQLPSWGVKNVAKAKKIIDIAKQGAYQHACSCFFESCHDIEDTGKIIVQHPNNYFDQSFKWRNGTHPIQVGDQQTSQSQMSTMSTQSTAYSQIDWKENTPMSQAEITSQFTEDMEE